MRAFIFSGEIPSLVKSRSKSIAMASANCDLTDESLTTQNRHG
jgi:hypothetical protein